MYICCTDYFQTGVRSQYHRFSKLCVNLTIAGFVRVTLRLAYALQPSSSDDIRALPKSELKMS